MPRPKNEKLKSELRAARAAGASIEALMADFGVSRNTVFRHLRVEGGGDAREKYTAADRARIARMSTDELHEEARLQGKTFTALQRVAYREREHQRAAQMALAAEAIKRRGFVNIAMESELVLVDLSQDMVELANKRLSVYRLRLAPPNRLETLDGTGRYTPLTLAFQKALITDTLNTLKTYAAKIKASWRTV